MVFLGDGPLGQMTAISSDGGYVKGFVGNPLCDALYKENGKVRSPATSFSVEVIIMLTAL